MHSENTITLYPGLIKEIFPKEKFRICSKTVMDNSDPLISFNEKGECHYVEYFENTIKPNWHPDNGENYIDRIVETMKKDKGKNEYDCIIGLSGGVDSSYLAYKAATYGLKILAVHVDGGWNSELAVKNIENIVNKCNIDLYTHVVNWADMRNLQIAFLKSGISNQDIPQDHAFFAGLYHFAIKNKIKWVLHGGNIASEVILPTAWGYNAMDSRFISDIFKKFGNGKLIEYPLINFFQYYIYYPYILKMKSTRLLDFMPYNKENAIIELGTKIGFNYYGGKHYESRFTRFFQSFYLPYKFGYDKRKAHLSSLILSGQLSRKDALEVLQQPLYSSKLEFEADRDYIIKKLGLTLDDFNKILNIPIKEFSYYKNNDKLLKKIVKYKRLILK